MMMMSALPAATIPCSCVTKAASCVICFMACTHTGGARCV
jgi:hypothetical protein